VFKTTAVNHRVINSSINIKVTVNLVWPPWTIFSILAEPLEDTTDLHMITSNILWRTIGSWDPVATLLWVRVVVIGPPRDVVRLGPQKETDGNYQTYLVISSQHLVVDTIMGLEEVGVINNADNSTINVTTTDISRGEAIRVAIITQSPTIIIEAMTWLV
jgi:hypothetical protein